MGMKCMSMPADVFCNGNLHFHDANIDDPESKPFAEWCPNSTSPKQPAWVRQSGYDRDPDADWWVKARSAILALARTGNPFTADDLTNRVGWPIESNNVGALFRETAVGNMIRQVGVTQSKRPEAHGRDIKVWQGWRQHEEGVLWQTKD